MVKAFELGFGATLTQGQAYDTKRWYLPFSGGNLAPGSLEMKFLKELTWRLNSPDVSPGLTQSVMP